MKNEGQSLKKRKSRAFGKDIYLLGEDEHGILYWLEAPRWECEWYWGFGYIETYTNNEQPNISKDINSHEHAGSFMSEWFMSWNGSKPRLSNPVFSEKEGWELSELFEQFYFLKTAAANFATGKCHVADTTINSWEEKELAKKINETTIPMVTARIIEILSPA